MINAPKLRGVLLTAIFIFCLLGNDTAFAAAGCTTDPQYQVPNNMQIITTLVDHMTCILYGKEANPACSGNSSISESMFNTFITDSGFANTLRIMAVLFMVIFAISFTLGIVQMTLIEFVMSALKLSIIALFLSSSAWTYFYNTVGVFFQNGTNWLIAISTKIALGSVAGADPSKPFQLIDYTIATALSPKMLANIMAMFFTGPYGLLFGVLCFLGLMSFVGALFQAMWIYLMSMIIRAFLFGLAPLFMPFFLFPKTRYLFDGWLNQLVNSMLQPTLLFTFFAFFCTLIQSSMNFIMRVKVCYVEMDNIYAGAANTEKIPRFIINGVPENIEWNFKGAQGVANGPAFPIDIMDVLIFLLLAQLAWRFNGVALNVAKELSGAAFSMNTSGALANMISPTREHITKGMEKSEVALQQFAKKGGNMQDMANNNTVKGIQDQARKNVDHMLNKGKKR